MYERATASSGTQSEADLSARVTAVAIPSEADLSDARSVAADDMEPALPTNAKETHHIIVACCFYSPAHLCMLRFSVAAPCKATGLSAAPVAAAPRFARHDQG